MTDEFDPNAKEVYSGASEVTKNIIVNFRMADECMKNWQLYRWFKCLESIHIEIMYKLDKDERKECDDNFKAINPYTKNSYPMLRKFHIKLRDLCGKYKFFDMINMWERKDPSKSVYPGGR